MTENAMVSGGENGMAEHRDGDADPLRRWLQEFPVMAARARVKELTAKKDEILAGYARLPGIDAELQRLTSMLDAYGATNDMASTAEPGPAIPSAATSGDARGMEAVERVMRDRPGVWTRRDIAEALILRGWLDSGDKGRRTIGSLMNRMVKRGRIERAGAPGEGLYRLPAVHQEVLS